MKTNYAAHNKKATNLKKRLKVIEDKYPNFDFKNSTLRSDLEKYWKLQKELIYESVDANACKSDNPDFLCSDCTCWKRTRALCS